MKLARFLGPILPKSTKRGAILTSTGMTLRVSVTHSQEEWSISKSKALGFNTLLARLSFDRYEDGNMKLMIFLFVTFFGALTLAQEKDKPFVLADGKYVLECWGLNIVSNADSSIGRSQSYQAGTDLVSSANGITFETLKFQSEDGTQTQTMARTTATTDLGSGLFKQTVEIKNDTKRATFEVQLKAEDNFNFFLSASWDGKPVDVKGREFNWRVMSDGRVFAQDYLLPTPNRLVSNSTCIFTPAN